MDNQFWLTDFMVTISNTCRILCLQLSVKIITTTSEMGDAIHAQD